MQNHKRNNNSITNAGINNSNSLNNNGNNNNGTVNNNSDNKSITINTNSLRHENRGETPTNKVLRL